ncbi:DAO-domain-containing protein [Auriscalpium vulgare]|uniref:DAO-domain-containing protein n=1 Tax=Auriscalpium vulgare TaxID=40419 RepID=A0ACB8S4Q9_9AGAM|nr:DAO-domain-containing protein [Auriscalpium vulgare]
MASLLRRTRVLFTPKALAYASAATVAAAGGGYLFLNSGPAYPASTRETRRPPPPWLPPTRAQNLAALRAAGAGGDAEFDLLVVGGGATGAGVAVDAASRGLKVALVERDDFSSGTSSKSTKLVHGGVRYLQKAVMELDYEQYKLVREALHERRIFLQTAPYLSHMLPIMLPIYKYWQVPYYWAGCKMYDVLAGKENMESSYVMSKGKALEMFPMLKSDGLVGALVYYDGQHNDARMNMALIMTAVKLGATVANKVEVTELRKNAAGKLDGARVRDNLTGEEWEVKAKGIINATGPFSDSLLSKDNPNHKPIVQASSGVHITLPNYYSPRTMGLLDPATSDGRVIFFLPWEGNTIAGTTDAPAPVTDEPRAAEDEIRWVLDEVRHYLSPDIKVRRGDVLSAWSGLRPLVRNPNASSTEGLVRNHMIHVSDSGLLTIAGGKWTTYRAMAQETVDEAVKVFGLEGRVKSGCVTESVRLVGSDGWSRNMFIGLIQRYGLDTEVAKHLSNNYGDRAWTVLSLAQPTGENWPVYGIRLANPYPFIEAEVRYAVRHEYALTAVDVVARRLRLSFLNAQATLDALPRVIDIMGAELGWTAAHKQEQFAHAAKFLQSMGLQPTPEAALAPESVGWKHWAAEKLNLPLDVTKGAKPSMPFSRAQFEVGEVDELRAAFLQRARDVPGEEKRLEKGAVKELLAGFQSYAAIGAKEFDYVMEETGFAKQKDVDLDEFVEICADLKEVSFAPITRSASKKRMAIPVEKSGGGV